MRGPEAIRLPLGVLPVVVLAAAVGAGVPIWTGIEPIVGAIAGSVLFFGVLRLCGRFPDEVREMLRGRTSVFGE
jgi:uncharacterized membrane protein YdjX (TVP38/TMEM64 family)